MNGMLSLYSAAILFAVASVFVKIAATAYGGPFVSSVRFLIGVVLCLVTLGIRRTSLRPKNGFAVIMRGISGALSMIMSYAAISLTGPGRATLLGNLYPLFVPLFARLFFGERFQRSTIPSLLLCTVGAVAVVGDGSGVSFWGDLLALGGAIVAAVAVNFVRRASATDDPVLIYLSPSVIGLAMFAVARPPAAFPGIVPTLALVAVGFIAFAAQLLMTRGYRTVQAGRGSLVFFSETALTVLLGLLVAGERFNLRFAAGFVLILVGLWWNAPRGPHGPRGKKIEKTR